MASKAKETTAPWGVRLARSITIPGMSFHTIQA